MVDLRFWHDGFSALNIAIENVISAQPSLLCTHPPVEGENQEEAVQFLHKALSFLLCMVDFGYFRQFVYFSTLRDLLFCRKEEIFFLAMKVLLSLTGNSEAQFKHRNAPHLYFPLPFRTKSGGALIDWPLSKEFDFLFDYLKKKREDFVDEKKDVVALFDSLPINFADDGMSQLLLLRMRHSRHFSPRFQVMVQCLAKKKVKKFGVHFEDAMRVLCDDDDGDMIVVAGQVLIQFLDSSVLLSKLVSKVTRRGLLVEKLVFILSQLCASPELKLGYTFTRVAMGVRSEDYFLRLEVLIHLASACVHIHKDLKPLFVANHIVDLISKWIAQSLTQFPALSKEELGALAAGLFFLEAWESRPLPFLKDAASEMVSTILHRNTFLLGLLEENLLTRTVSLLHCAKTKECEDLLQVLFENPALFAPALFSACELIPFCKPVLAFSEFVSGGFLSCGRYEAVLGLISFTPSGVLRNVSLLTKEKMEHLLSNILTLFRRQEWFSTLFMGTQFLGQFLANMFSDLEFTRRCDIQSFSALVKQALHSSGGGVGETLLFRLISELCHSRVFARAYLVEKGLTTTLASMSTTNEDTLSSFLRIAHNCARHCRKQCLDEVMPLVMSSPHTDILCEVLVMLLSSPFPFLNYELFVPCFNFLVAWDRKQSIVSRHFLRLLQILPSLPHQQNKLSECFACGIEAALEDMDVTRLLMWFQSLGGKGPLGSALLPRLSAFGTLQPIVRIFVQNGVMDLSMTTDCLQCLGFLLAWSDFRLNQAMKMPLVSMMVEELSAILEMDCFVDDIVLAEWIVFLPSLPKLSEPHFVPLRSVIFALADMGFHGSHIRMAQIKLKTNNISEVTQYLLAEKDHLLAVSEEEEEEFAVWLSMEDSDDSAETMKDPMDVLTDKVLSACASLTMGPRSLVPMELTTLLGGKEGFILNPRKAVPTKVFFSNEFDESVEVSCVGFPTAVVEIPALTENFEIDTSVGCILEVKHAERGVVLGQVKAVYNHAMVWIRQKQWERIEMHKDSSELNVRQSNQRQLQKFSVKESEAVEVRFVNSSRVRTFFHQLFTHGQESFVVEPESELTVFLKRNSLWLGSGLSLFSVGGVFLVPEYGTDPFLISIPVQPEEVAFLDNMFTHELPRLMGETRDVSTLFALTNDTCRCWFNSKSSGVVAAADEPNLKQEFLSSDHFENRKRRWEGKCGMLLCPLRAKRFLLVSSSVSLDVIEALAHTCLPTFHWLEQEAFFDFVLKQKQVLPLEWVYPLVLRHPQQLPCGLRLVGLILNTTNDMPSKLADYFFDSLTSSSSNWDSVYFVLNVICRQVLWICERLIQSSELMRLLFLHFRGKESQDFVKLLRLVSSSSDGARNSLARVLIEELETGNPCKQEFFLLILLLVHFDFQLLLACEELGLSRLVLGRCCEEVNEGQLFLYEYLTSRIMRQALADKTLGQVKIERESEFLDWKMDLAQIDHRDILVENDDDFMFLQPRRHSLISAMRL